MSASIDFYFDFSSPYGYLASEKIEAMAARHGRGVDWHPILLGVIFKQTGAVPLTMVPLKGEYSKRDMRRSARFHGVTDFRMPSKFPIPSQAPARIVLWQKPHDAALAAKVVHALYELLFNDALAVELRPQASAPESAAITLGPEALRPVGFGDDETLLPTPDRLFRGYRVLQEYFSFPEKFLFVDLDGLERLQGRAFTDTLDVRILLGRPFAAERSISAQTFRLHAAPIVNLFPQMAEPIRVTHLSHEYRVIPNVRRPGAHEVWSVDSVTTTGADVETVRTYQPFFAFRHDAERAGQQTLWHASRRPSERKDDDGTEVFLTLVDMNFDPTFPDTDTLSVHVTSSNRDLPGRLPFGNPEGDFQLEGPGVFTSIRMPEAPPAPSSTPITKSLHGSALA